jgi:hypothetical protein
LGSKDIWDDYESGNRAYFNFIENVLYYQRIFEYSGNIIELMELPYCLFQDLILQQIKLKKKENQEIEKQRAKIAKSNKRR